jgi:hypothetical protein
MSYGAVFSFAPLTLWVRIPLRRGVLEITLCDKVCQWFSQPIKLTTMAWYSWNTIESSVKHHNPNPVFSLAAQPGSDPIQYAMYTAGVVYVYHMIQMI